MISFLPGTYGTSLLRNYALRGVFEKMGAQGFPSEVVEAIQDSVLYFFGDQAGLGNPDRNHQRQYQPGNQTVTDLSTV